MLELTIDLTYYHLCTFMYICFLSLSERDTCAFCSPVSLNNLFTVNPEFVHRYLSSCSLVTLSLFTGIPSIFSLHVYNHAYIYHLYPWICSQVSWIWYMIHAMNKLRNISEKIDRYWWTNLGTLWTNWEISVNKLRDNNEQIEGYHWTKS